MAVRTPHKNLITIDMGGTSYDVCLIAGGRAQTTSNTYFERHAVALPMFAVHTIGAGGGSIARIDGGGGLRVGPASAGAVPGPACYGRGGNEPTVTDANLVLGYLNPEAIYGGSIALCVDAARTAIRTRIAKPLGLSLEDAALGILRMINAHMTNGIRVVSVQQGHDPRDFVLVAYGGNGAVHAVRQAEELDIDTVLVPRMAGAFSAYGGLFADAQVDHMATWVGRCDTADCDALAQAIRELAEKGTRVLGGGCEVRHEAYLACHYEGQTSEIWVPIVLDGGEIAQRVLAQAAECFHREHERERTFGKRDEPVHIIGAKVTSRRPHEKPPRSENDSGVEAGPPESASSRDVYFDAEHGWTPITIYSGTKLAPGIRINGPAIIEEPDSTVVVYSGWSCRLGGDDI
jgi:N-methylhydantoinase A